MHAEITKLIDDPRRPGLAFGPPVEAMHSRLDALAELSPALRAGLWLHFDFFEESHSISQDLRTPEGSYWHAILHRREPDAFNAKYWFRQVGVHAIFSKLAAAAHSMEPSFSKSHWDPVRFVDLCEAHRGTGSAMESKLIEIQSAEWRLLMEHCLTPQ
jgi:hypothetical protein